MDGKGKGKVVLHSVLRFCLRFFWLGFLVVYLFSSLVVDSLPPYLSTFRVLAFVCTLRFELRGGLVSDFLFCNFLVE